MVKRFSAVILALAVLLTATVCSAAAMPKEIDQSEIALGGISIGATETYVKSIYGEPDSVSPLKFSGGYGGYQKTSTYGTFEIMYVDDRVVSLTTTAHNGITTPAGFSVGDRINDVRNYFGADYYSDADGLLRCNWHFYMSLAFRYNSEGRITEIFCNESP